MTTVKNILYWLIANSVGGYNRGLILDHLFNQPENAHNLSIKLGIDYNTIRYHIDVLIKNGLVEAVGNSYGRTYFITKDLMDNKHYFYELWNKFEKKINNKRL